MATLAAALDDACARRPRVLMLVGDAGIGKTRMVEEFASRLSLGPQRVLWGRCPEHGGAPPYWPWIQAIGRHVAARDAAEVRRELGGHAADVANVVPAVRAALGLDLAPGNGHEGSRFGFFEGVTDFLRRAAADEPLVTILDDLHWADEDSLALLDFVARDVRGAQRRVIGTNREIEMHRRPRLLGTIAHVSDRVRRRGLGRTEVARLIESATAAPPASDLVATLHESTDGNPFFLDEMIRMLAAGGRMDASLAGSGVPILPDSVRDAIRRRFETLSPEERAVLEIAATLGREFDLGPLRLACEIDAATALDRLAAPIAVRLVEEQADAPGRYRFVHALVREVLYRDLLPARRALMHLRVGRALESLHAESREPPVVTLAHHYLQAASLGDPGKAVDYATRAGAQAMALLAYEDARAHYAQALTATSFEPPDEARRLRLLLALGNATWRCGDNIKAREVFLRAARTARALGDSEALIRAAVGFGHACPDDGHVDAVLIGLLEEALRACAGRDPSLEVALLGRLAAALYFAPDGERRTQLSARAVEIARRTGDPVVIAAALRTEHLLAYGPRPLAERLAIADEALTLATGAGHRRLAADLHAARTLDLLELGDIEAVERELDAFTQAADEARAMRQRWHAAVVRTTVALLAGRFDAAAGLAAAALAMRQDGQDSSVAQLFATQMFLLRRDTGGLAGVAGMLEGFAREFPTFRSWALALALLHAETGAPDRARTGFDQVAARDFSDLPHDGSYVQCLALAAEIAAALGDARRADSLYPLLLPFEERNVVISVGGGCFGSAARHLGLLAALRGDRVAAERHFTRALDANRRMGARPFIARTELAWAELLLGSKSRGAGTPAAKLLGDAREIADALGMEPLLRRVAEVGHAAPTGPAAGATPPPKRDRARGAHAAAAETERPPAQSRDAILRCDGEYWTIALDQESLRLRDSKGLVYLAQLIRNAGSELHVLDLVRDATPSDAAATVGEAMQAGLSAGDLGDAGVVVDREARAAYKRRLADLGRELEDARAGDDEDRVARAEREIEFLTAELSRAVGLGGRERRAGSAAERARVNVSRTVGAVLRKITERCPMLGQHLAACVRTGVFCSYTPDPRLPLSWRL